MNADGMRPVIDVKDTAVSASAVSARSAKAVLQKNFLFRGLPDSALERIAALATRRSYPKGAVIFSQGQPGDALFGVIAGQVRISASGTAGQEVFLNIMEPGDTFGEVAVMDGLPRTAGACALEDTSLIVIKRTDFLKLLEREPCAPRKTSADPRVAARPLDERRRARAADLSVGSRALPEHLAPDREPEPEPLAQQRLGQPREFPNRDQESRGLTPCGRDRLAPSLQKHHQCPAIQ